MAVLPADHYLSWTRIPGDREAALDIARHPGRMGARIPPTRPETGFGYVERMSESIGLKGFPVFPFCDYEKPELKLAQEYVALQLPLECRDFFWRVSTFSKT